MKFATLSGQIDGAKVDDGVWIPLLGTKKDEDGARIPLYCGDTKDFPARALVRSYRSRAMREATESLQRSGFVKIAKAKGDKAKEEAQANAVQLPPALRLHLLVARLENCDEVPGSRELTLEDAKDLLADSQYCFVVDQIIETAYDDERYFTPAEIADLKAKDDAPAGEPTAEA
jgi:hypothetical protein